MSSRMQASICSIKPYSIPELYHILLKFLHILTPNMVAGVLRTQCAGKRGGSQWQRGCDKVCSIRLVSLGTQDTPLDMATGGRLSLST